MKRPVFNVYLKKGVDGFIIAECPEIPGCMSQGRTIDEAKANIKEAISACLSVILEDHLDKQRKTRKLPCGLIEKDRFEVSSFEMVAL
ncbi:MAG: type II toxin-antitoxin system HicB family antitoxin [bacterium]